MRVKPSKKYLTIIMMVIFIFTLSTNCFAYEPYETDQCWIQLSNVDEEGTIVTIYNESLDTKAFLLNYETNSDTGNRELALYGMAGDKKVDSVETTLETGVTYKIEKVDGDIIITDLSNDETITLSASDDESREQLEQTDSMWKGECYFDEKWENNDPFEVEISVTGDDLPETTEEVTEESTEEFTEEETTEELESTEESTEEESTEEITEESTEQSTEEEESSSTGTTSSSKTTITASGESVTDEKQTVSQQKNIIRFLLIVIVVMAIIVTIMTIMVMKSTGADDNDNNHMADKVTKWKDTK